MTGVKEIQRLLEKPYLKTSEVAILLDVSYSTAYKTLNSMKDEIYHV